MTNPTTTETLAAGFESPPLDVRPWVTWRWRTLDPEALSCQFKRLKREAVGPVVVAVDPALEGQDGIARRLPALRAVSRLAEELEHPLWLELPSFHEEWLRPALVGERGRHRARVVRIEEWETRPGKWRKRKLESPVILGLAAPLKLSEHLNLSHALDITQALERFETPRGLRASVAYRVIACTVGVAEFADCLLAEPVEAYIEQVLEPLLQAVGRRFGVSVQGLMIPAPTMLPAGAADPGLPWPTGLMEEFAAQHDYALIPQLPALAVDTGVAHPRVRRNYWEAIAGRYRGRALAPLRDWCHANGAQVCFVPPQEADLRTAVRQCADPALAHGMSDVRLIVGSKEGRLTARTASVCRAGDGRPRRCLLRVEDALAGDPLSSRRGGLATCSALGLGGSLIELPDPVEQLPEKEAGQTLNRWSSRGHWLSSAGSRRCQVALLRPFASLWAHCDSVGRDPLFGVLETDLAYAADMLASLGHEFDLVADEQLRIAETVDERLAVGGALYEMVVLPSVTFLPPAAWDVLVEFVRAGGKVAALGLLPRESESGLDSEFAARVQADTLVDLDYIYLTYEQAAVEGDAGIDSFPIFREDPSEGRFCSYQPRLCEDQDDARLRVMQIMVESLDAEVEGRTEDLACEHRQLDDANLYVVTNLGDQPTTAKLRLRRTGVPSRWDVDEGRVTECREYAVIDDSVTAFRLALAPNETTALSIRPGVHSHVDGANFVVTQLSERTRGLLTASGYSMKGGRAAALFEPATGRSDWVEDLVNGQPRESGLDGPWALSFSQRTRCRLTAWEVKPGRHLPSLSSRVTGRWSKGWASIPSDDAVAKAGATFRTVFSLGSAGGRAPATALCLVPEGQWLQLVLNGAELPLAEVRPSEAGYLELPVTRQLKAAENELVLFAQADGAPTVLPPLPRALWFEMPAASLAAEGAAAEELRCPPGYRGTVEATGTMEVPPDLRETHLFLVLEDCLCPAEVFVNGQRVGRRWARPHRFEVTDRARPGANEVALRFCVARDLDGPLFRSASLLALPPVHLTFDPAGIRPARKSSPLERAAPEHGGELN